MEELKHMLAEAFPGVHPRELAYFPVSACPGAERLGYTLTILEVSLETSGCAGGFVAAVTGQFQGYEETDTGPVPAGLPLRHTLNLEFEGEQDLRDPDAWARGLRHRIKRDLGVVAAVEADSGVLWRECGLERMGVMA